MRAITVLPGIANSARLDEVPEPPPSDGAILVRTRALGVCATDREILSGAYGTAPPGQGRLVLGHKSLGTVETAPADSEVAPGDLVVGIVRRPDPQPCSACAVGEWDMCRNGGYTERGIKERHGYGAERFRIEPEFVVKVDPALDILGVLLEPASVLAKAWNHIERIGQRARGWQPRSLLVTGAGPIGLLAALMGKQRGLDVHVLDQVTKGAKPRLVHGIDATYHHSDMDAVMERVRPDVVIEATGVPTLVFGALAGTAAYGITVLTGVSSRGRTIRVDGGELNRDIVLENDAVVGSVNANLRHYEQAADALAKADPDWLGQLVSRRVPLADFADAFEPRDDDVKVVLTFD